MPGVFCFEEVEAVGPASDRPFYTATPLGDGRILLRDHDGELSVLEFQSGAPVIVVAFSLPPTDEHGVHVSEMLVAELDGDPGPEAIVHGTRWIYLLDIGADAIELLSIIDGGLKIDSTTIDVDGDGLDEVVGSGGHFSAWKVGPEWPWDRTQITMPNPPCNATRKVVADFDGDGADDMLAIASTDVLAGCPDTFDDTYVLLNRFAARGGDDPFDVSLAPSLGFSPDFMRAADMDGDGALDLVVVSPGLPALLLRGDGRGTFAGPVDLSFAPEGSAAVGDFDGDGSTDIVAPDRSGSEPILAFRRSTDAFATTHEVPQQYEVLAATDVNGDGVDDILFRTSPPKLLLSDP